MRKVENQLILPVVILYISSFLIAGRTVDVHLHDTYFVLEGLSFFRIIAGLLLLIFGLYKTIRHRHQNINIIFALPHIFLTILLTGLLLLPFIENRLFIDYSNYSPFKNQWRWCVTAGLLFLLFQVIFLVYFIVQLLKKPVIQRW